MNKIIRTTPGKIIIYLLTCMMMLTAVVAAGIAAGNYVTDMYEHSPKDLIADDVEAIAYGASHLMLSNVLEEMSRSGELDDVILTESYDGWYTSISENYMYSIIDENGKVLRESQNFNKDKIKYSYYLKADMSSDDMWNAQYLSREKDDPKGKYITVRAYYEGNNGMPILSSLRLKKSIYELLYNYRDIAIPVGIISTFLSLLFFIMLLCVSARRPGSDELHPGYFNKVPFDIIFAIAMTAGAILLGVTVNIGRDTLTLIMAGVVIVYSIAAFNALCMSAASRIKQGNLFSNTLIWIVCKWCFKTVKLIITKFVFGIIKWGIGIVSSIAHTIGELFGKLSLIRKTVVIIAAISFLDFFVYPSSLSAGGFGLYFVYWLLEHAVLFVLICKFVLGLRGLQEGGRALAAGDFDHKVDTSKLHMDFKEHGENLNRISEGMVLAVEEKMKSERMKTELITNVSHDIKTPLTSIINYADLIGKEDTDNEKIKEYTEVLLRQSERLKRLIEDLVEASKASTGNLEVELAPCDASMFITQIAGEYEEKLKNAGLTLVTKGLDNSANIMADGRRMLRVFDNLMNNICKYALENSRVYLSLEVKGAMSAKLSQALVNTDSKTDANTNMETIDTNAYNHVLITFKNTSKTELDISPEELMERFVRGDQSRNTEGNGLGLSIARSLTELQNGTFDISIDGDLFKVVLAFPTKE